MNFIRDAWDILWEFLGWFQICTFIDPWEEGILVRRGKFSRVVKTGVAWHLPLEIDEITVVNVRPTAMELDEQSIVTEDGVEIVCKVVMMWSIFDVKKSFLDVEDVRETLENFSLGLVRDSVKDQDWEYVQTDDFLTDLKKPIQKQARKWGIAVTNVKFQDLTRARAHRVFGGLA
jgi:regulator of protease activity HflC (stomatin/prohibitin superfamily)